MLEGSRASVAPLVHETICQELGHRWPRANFSASGKYKNGKSLACNFINFNLSMPSESSDCTVVSSIYELCDKLEPCRTVECIFMYVICIIPIYWLLIRCTCFLLLFLHVHPPPPQTLLIRVFILRHGTSL